MAASCDIAIVMAACNGEEYIRAQIESIQNQTIANWKLIIRDDESTDSTLAILSELANNDGRIKVIADKLGPQKSAQKNFSLLVNVVIGCECGYVFFSDQDDLWERDKLEKMMMYMHVVEADFPEAPIMIHSDLIVVDANNNELASSFLRFQGLRHENIFPLRVLLAQNFVTGCASLVNLSLLKIAAPFPNEMMMHDWWLALCAASTGKLLFVPERMVRYRQHGMNSIGAKGYWARLNPFATSIMFRWRRGKKNISGTINQARALSMRVDQELATGSVPLVYMDTIRAYARLMQLSPAARLGSLQKYRIQRQTLLTDLIFKLRVFFM
ncbi:Glycosyltransferase involved in cell wall bisynthesis [endosymbiont of Ridgeia piscesae]|uniref:Glycosyltransferase involved in cell wall bisynthesis n=2 Tax=endosymbiont of Ridgeia piscesae TaxID=54398 RepID=A0A0T5Z2W1_9GAMM|nr:Glycosyltransferase involved in cell wall bisynthesis [endosymbiont of Ridgeia piscesae]KRT57103.1 Glycosyltransferase involved in cell wall bisynthesis [endosymbiont of Ridgeia piscesae]